MEDGREHDPLAGIVDRWRGLRVVVVGDVMLDEWRYADPRRLYREAATPVYGLRRRQDAAGGAGNTAVNLAALGADPVLISAVGDDDSGGRLRACLAAARVRDALVTVPGARTVAKRRLVVADQIILCEEDGAAELDMPAAAEEAVLDALRRHTRPGLAALVVICDYGKGTLTGRIRAWLGAHRPGLGVVALDAADVTRWSGLAPTLVTPSYTEARPLLGRLPAAGDSGADRAAVVAGRGAQVRRRSGARITAVTLDRSGAVVLAPGADPYRTYTEPAPPARTIGAGDAYLAAAGLALAVGGDAAAAAELAQLTATATLGETATCVCTRAQLLAALQDHPAHHGARVVDAAALVELVQHRRARGARVVFTNGCFDVLHRGHVGYLSQARQLGDMLIVAVNSDASVRRLKGPQRPVNPVEDRVAVLAALWCVDLVVVFEEDSPAALIEAVRPDVYVKGGDYRLDTLPEAELVRRLGGEVRMLDYIPDRSTSAVIERIRSRAPIPQRFIRNT
jgi:rfaE bifunctional protein nucleotidyltransferase chain/domain/rfaE bifunctional protein kinase chain/domain